MAFKLTVVALVLAFAYSASAASHRSSEEVKLAVEPVEEAHAHEGHGHDPLAGSTLADHGTSQERQSLLNSLLANYNKNSNPSNLKVKHGISVVHIDVESAHKVLEVDSFIKYLWTDDRLTWEPSAHGGINSIRVPSDLLWIPDIRPYNLASSGKETCDHTHTIVKNTGAVIWVPPCHEHFHCNFTLDKEPYGEQSCVLKYGSWTFDAVSMDIQPWYDNKPNMDIEHMFGTNGWKVTGTSFNRTEKKYECCLEPYVTLDYTIKFQRETAECVH